MKSLWVSAVFFLVFSISTARAQGCSGIAAAINLVPPVTEAPFTADYTHVFEPANPDGSRNHQESHGKLYRDSEGRARCDVENGKTHKTKFVTISDPVAKLSIRMNLEEQTARVTHFSGSSSPSGPSKPSPPQNVQSKSPVNAKPRITHTEEDLDSKEIEGLMATGKHSVNTGAQTSTTEEWYSPDLKFTLLYIHDDSSPSSSSHMRDELKNIHRDNPDPSVFKVPEGFTVKDLYCRGQVCTYDSE